MATWTLTFLPIQQVLLHGGEIEFDKLAKKLVALDPRRFRDEKTVEDAVNTYIHCLNMDDVTRKISFNRKALRYAEYGMMERSIQYELHRSVPDMENWQLYPLMTRNNSKCCYVGVPWGEIPRDVDNEQKNLPFEDDCDFRAEDVNGCYAGCGVSEDVLRRWCKLDSS